MFMSEMAERISKARTLPSPVFIVGMNGSGTTMLADSLGKHPDLYMFPAEAKIISYFMHNKHLYGDLATFDSRRRLADDIGRTKSFWRINGKTPLVLEDFQLNEPGFDGVIHAIFDELASRESKQRWGEKTPMNLQHIVALAEAFPSAQFVHIIRDGREVAQSFHRRWRYHPQRTIYRWKKLVALGREQGYRLDSKRYLEVNYEKLTGNPESEMRRVCNFLNLSFVCEVTNSSMYMVDVNKASYSEKRIISNSEKWKKYFSSGQVTLLERIAGSYLAELGYKTTMQGNDDPTTLWLRCVLVRDSVLRSFVFFRKYGWRGIPAYIRSMQLSLKQRRVNKV
jgi:hypothetical protein